jgi:hypothetical protein
MQGSSNVVMGTGERYQQHGYVHWYGVAATWLCTLIQSSSNVAETSVVKCGEKQRGGHAAERGDVRGYMCVGYSNVADMLQSVEMYVAIYV